MAYVLHRGQVSRLLRICAYLSSEWWWIECWLYASVSQDSGRWLSRFG